jgi:tRNA pseudouridine55 synthase
MAADDSAWHGLLAVDKPAGVTSHDVVLRVRRRLGVRGAGHLGTLDPAASGLLVIALGAATRAVPVWQGGEKTYEGTIRFGIETDSQDLDGTVIAERALGTLDEAQVRAAVAPFLGTIAQTPPMVSALKVGGRRLHALARRGIEVERAPRTITVHGWEWLAIELPEARFRIRCSGGTYVRTLAHDLGRALGPGAALAMLRRTRSEPFDLERAVTTEDLDRLEPRQVLEQAGIPIDRALEILPAMVLDASAASALGVGGRPPVELDGAGAAPPIGAGPRSVVFRDAAGRALALGELMRDGGTLLACPHVVFPWAVRIGPAVVRAAGA